MLGLALGLVGTGVEAAEPERVRVEWRTGEKEDPASARLAAVLTAGNEMYLEAQPLPGEGFLAFCRRLCVDSSAARRVREAHGTARSMLAGRWYRLPFELASPDSQRAVLRALFPESRLERGELVHVVGNFHGLPEESLWRIAHRFTGEGARFRAVREHNRLADNTLYRGQELRIPAALLRPELRRLLPPGEALLPAKGAVEGPREAAVGAATPQTKTVQTETAEQAAAQPAGFQAAGQSAAGRSEPGAPAPEAAAVEPPPAAAPPVAAVLRRTAWRLEYGRDEQGDYAVYRLKPGEALYSSVVVRFTGRIYAADVNALAATIARRNGVADVTDMPIGFPVKIPLDLLQPEFLPEGDPRRQTYEQTERASAQFSNPVRSRDLAGITVILDAGHGGTDVGATMQGIWESVYVYDIMVRLKAHLEATTAAEVFTTTRDTSRNGSGDSPVERDVLPYSRGHAVLTSPPYPLVEPSAAKVGVNLRWYLSNSLYRKALERGRDPEKIVFVSIHADSLHPSLRGAMAYIPDAYLRRGTYEKRGTAYSARLEVREKPVVSYSWQERVKSQGLSRQLAEHVVDAFRQRDLAVHPEQPVRQKIYRGRSPWVPAVLRYNAVPAEILLEVGNLANDQDRKLLTTRTFRQRAAEAIADGLRAYYGRLEQPEPSQLARTAR